MTHTDLTGTGQEAFDIAASQTLDVAQSWTKRFVAWEERQALPNMDLVSKEQLRSRGLRRSGDGPFVDQH